MTEKLNENSVQENLQEYQSWQKICKNMIMHLF